MRRILCFVFLAGQWVSKYCRIYEADETALRGFKDEDLL